MIVPVTVIGSAVVVTCLLCVELVCANASGASSVQTTVIIVFFMMPPFTGQRSRAGLNSTRATSCFCHSPLPPCSQREGVRYKAERLSIKLPIVQPDAAQCRVPFQPLPDRKPCRP